MNNCAPPSAAEMGTGELLRPKVATESSFLLAESPVWDPVRQLVLWADIEAGTVFTGTLRDDGSIDQIEAVPFDSRVGAVAVAANGDWVVAGDRRLVHRHADGTIDLGPVLIEPADARRLNDGKPDPAGRFVVGSLCMTGTSESEELLVVDEGGIRFIDHDLSLSNGMAWSADGQTFYSVDTHSRTIFRRSWDPKSGESGPRAAHIVLEDGYPDGLTIDSQDHLWVAVWGLGQVRRYSPHGELTTVIGVPVPFTSSVAFAGPQLETLVITTSNRDLDQEGRKAHPDAGRLFTVRPGVLGAPQPFWSGQLSPALERNP